MSRRPVSDADRAYARANLKAAQWVRTYRPEVWARLLDEAYAAKGLQRRRVGRPRRQR